MFSAFKGLYNSLWIQRLLALLSVAMLLWMLGQQNQDRFWWVAVVAALVLVLEYLAFYRGIEYGIRTFYNMSRRDQMRLIKLLEPDDEPKDTPSDL